MDEPATAGQVFVPTESRSVAASKAKAPTDEWNCMNSARVVGLVPEKVMVAVADDAEVAVPTKTVVLTPVLVFTVPVVGPATTAQVALELDTAVAPTVADSLNTSSQIRLPTAPGAAVKVAVVVEPGEPTAVQVILASFVRELSPVLQRDTERD